MQAGSPKEHIKRNITKKDNQGISALNMTGKNKKRSQGWTEEKLVMALHLRLEFPPERKLFTWMKLIRI